MAPGTPDREAACPTCAKPVGDHTIRDFATCTEGLNYHLPYEPVDKGPLRFEGIEGEMVGEVTVVAAVVKADIGKFPALRFNFYGTGTGPMEHRPLPPITLVLDANGLKQFRQLVATSVDQAILAARRDR